MQIVRKLPEHVELSEHLRKKADFFIIVQSLGTTYYVPATPHVRRLLELNSNGREEKPDRRIRWGVFEKEHALRDIVAALSLQVRDVELAGVEQHVLSGLMKGMEEALRPTVRKRIEQAAGPLLLQSGDEQP